ncbi:hypothetical protein [Bacillus solitudinis]|uniref:hypothetical protein n=1 Tax=Bacillus solitudinis TaxID=2014074 RepID=UPI0012FE2F02|nr:hypothetical protein [Bacillus solitudinis]
MGGISNNADFSATMGWISATLRVYWQLWSRYQRQLGFSVNYALFISNNEAFIVNNALNISNCEALSLTMRCLSATMDFIINFAPFISNFAPFISNSHHEKVTNIV